MKTENIILTKDNNISFELIDLNNDVFTHTITSDVKLLDLDTDENFTHRYPVKLIFTLFNHNPTNTFEIGQKGILKININNLDVYVLPQI